ncbi:hypothetical protein [Duganella phyllosphaerae]|uniref:Uncharacterized protein n=1 Tax=Duganella phyllosphaerae TaxID=762836 RepID=A0A1E7WHB3_9BURK|nr:hypothetical protein [Duganella phyllosphaerae]OEZ97987.1 hypothetical protein DUPY_32580 [Duganella phyllosphaerae]
MEKDSVGSIEGAGASERDAKGAALRQACLDAADGEQLVFVNGHDDAILGLVEVDGDARVLYDQSSIFRKLARRDGMDREGAEEFFIYNVAGAFIGAPGPLFLSRIRVRVGR